MSSSELAGHDTLQPFKIPSLPPTFYYIPNFISEEEEASILQKIPAQRWVTLSHRRLQAHPSTLTANNTLLGAPLPLYLRQPIVERFDALGVFNNTAHQRPNHVLINEYNRGEGIMPHEDGNAYAEVVATISLGASLCLDISPKPKESKEDEKDSSVDEPVKALEAHQDDSQSLQYSIPTRIFQEPRSLLITTGTAYRNLLHGISPIEIDENLGPDTVANWSLLAKPDVIEQTGGKNERGTRISLTYRDVLKVSSAASKVLGVLRKR